MADRLSRLSEIEASRSLAGELVEALTDLLAIVKAQRSTNRMCHDKTCQGCSAMRKARAALARAAEKGVK